MKPFDIISGNLYTDLDTPYDSDQNKIDVYSSVNWTADNEEEYKRKEKLINEFKVDHELFLMISWCDVSGYNYWVVKQEEPNYVSIDVHLKKQPEKYTQEELQVIREEIIKADNYFNEVLT
jgi:hypothetical protein